MADDGWGATVEGWPSALLAKVIWLGGLSVRDLAAKLDGGAAGVVSKRSGGA